MPLVEVTLAQGRDPGRLRALMHQLHQAVVTTLGSSPESVRVIVREIPETHWAAGDETLAERRQCRP